MVTNVFVVGGLMVEESTVREEGSFSLNLYSPSLLNKHTSSYFDQFNCSIVALHPAFVKNIPVSTGQKNRNTILQHDDNFCCRNPIASSMKKTGATPDLPSSLSPQHGLRPSCCLVWSDFLYFFEKSHHFQHAKFVTRQPSSPEEGQMKILRM